LPETLRLFFAVPLPDEIRAAARELQQECACDEIKIGWTRPQNMHFTLKFLGDTPENRVPKLAEVAEQVAQSCPVHRVTVATVGAFPHTRRPRVIWLGCTDGAAELGHLGTELDRALAQAKLSRREKRDFVPHLTLGRVRGGHNFSELTAQLDRLADRVVGPMPVDHFVLMRSDLQPGQPPVYTELARLDLTGENPGQ